MNRQTDLDMRAVEFRADGTPTRYEVVHQPQAQPYIIGADDAPIVAPVQPDRLPRVQYIVTGSPIDEARAFNVKISSLATVLGGGAVLAAFVFGASLSFWSALMTFGLTFALTWAGAFVLDALRSPGGIELFHAWRLWAFLAREQSHRHRLQGAPTSTAPAWLGPVLLAGAVGFGGLFVLLIVGAVAVELMPK